MATLIKHVGLVLILVAAATIITQSAAFSQYQDNNEEDALVCKATPAVPATPATPAIPGISPATAAVPATSAEGGCSPKTPGETPDETESTAPSMVVPEAKTDAQIRIDEDRTHMHVRGQEAPIYMPLPIPLLKKNSDAPSKRGPLLRKDYRP